MRYKEQPTGTWWRQWNDRYFRKFWRTFYGPTYSFGDLVATNDRLLRRTPSVSNNDREHPKKQTKPPCKLELGYENTDFVTCPAGMVINQRNLTWEFLLCKLLSNSFVPNGCWLFRRSDLVKFFRFLHKELAVPLDGSLIDTELTQRRLRSGNIKFYYDFRDISMLMKDRISQSEWQQLLILSFSKIVSCVIDD